MNTNTALAIAALSLATAGCTKTTAPKAGTESMSMTSTMSDTAKIYAQSCKQSIESATKALVALEGYAGTATVKTVLEPLNALGITVDAAYNRAGLYSAVHPDADVRDAAESCEQELSKIMTAMNLSRPMFKLVSALDVSHEDDITKRMVEHMLRDFRRSGVDKDEPTRAQIKSLKEELVTIGQDFAKNIREDVRSIRIEASALKGLPADYIAAHKPDAEGKVVITTDYPDYIPFMTYAESDAARLNIYKQFRQRGYPKNIAILNSMLKKRYDLAKLLGYENWAHYITEDKMIKTAAHARSFIEKIAVASKQRAAADYKELLGALQKIDPKATKVGDWQKSYVAEILKKDSYAFDSQKLRAYFTYEKARDGLFAVTSKMFGIEYRPVKADVWHKDVEAYEIVDQGKVIGRFFLDMHPRDNKYKHAAAFPIVTGVNGVQVPEASLVCNFPAKGPMEHAQVETFFHEFGHLIHHLFGGEHRWVQVSGFNTEWDFVEAPSQMLEEWAWDPATLKTFAKNDKGEVIPDELLSAMNRARGFGKGLWVAHQMFYAAISLNFYDRDPEGLDTTATLKELQAQYSPFEYVDDTYFQLSFGHLNGYSAIYYTYMWSLVIAKDLFSVFQDQGMLNSDAASRYRQFILGPGGSKDAEAMVHDFLKRDYSFDSFGKWLNEG